MPPIAEKPGIFQHRMALLRHLGAPGPDHYDWLIQEGPEPESPLRSWRVDIDLMMLRKGDHFVARQIPHHRALYLAYEGPISGDRGSVQRVHEGAATMIDEGAHLHIMVQWNGGATQRLLGRRVDEAWWRFEVLE